MKANPNPLLLLPLLAFWRFGGSILRESLTVCRGLTATAFRRPFQAGCDRNSAVERGALLDRERPLFLLLRVVGGFCGRGRGAAGALADGAAEGGDYVVEVDGFDDEAIGAE